MRNKYTGKCFVCSKEVKKGEGRFQTKTHLPAHVKDSIAGKRILRCTECKGKGNTPLPVNDFNV